jgi:hypothetical protein
MFLICARDRHLSRRVRRYALAPQALAGAERWMLDQREIWEQRLDRMQDYVKGLATNKEKP